MSKTDVILQRLRRLHPAFVDLGLGRIHRLLAALDHPETRLPPVIHVAGTNGKGSTIAFMRAMLEAAGKSVHVYTSPSLVSFREQIRLGGKLVPPTVLNAMLEHCEAINAGQPITQFEIVTVAALALFAEHKADYLLLEVGMGGATDATNVVDHPIAAVITPVSLDHQAYLGNTVGAIATVKAGIAKPGAALVVGRQDAEARASIAARAKEIGVSPVMAGAEFSAERTDSGFRYKDARGSLDLPRPALLGRHQIDNAALAIATLRHLDIGVDESAIRQGLAAARWPGRLMRLNGKLNRFLTEGQELWLDGGHNPAGAQVLADAMAEMASNHPKPLVMVTGMLASKDAAGFFTPFREMPAKIFCVPLPRRFEAAKASQLRTIARGQGFNAVAMRSVGAALEAAGREFPNARVLICGSLYLAGEVLRQNGTVLD